MTRPHRRRPFAPWFFPALGAGLWSSLLITSLTRLDPSQNEPTSFRISPMGVFLLLQLSSFLVPRLSRGAAALPPGPGRLVIETARDFLSGPAVALIGLFYLLRHARFPTRAEAFR